MTCFFYKDSFFTFSIDPILGIDYSSNENGTFYHRWNGIGAYATLGKNWGFYASLRDNEESIILASPDFLTPINAGPYKGNEYSEMQGGITFSKKWVTIGLVKDHIEWGNHYHGANIISKKAPSFVMLKLNIKPARWFEFNYMHGWLASNVVDSLRTYNYAGTNRTIYHGKYIATNLFTITPIKKLNFSFGNSIVYSDLDVHPAYLIPVLFYKSVDYSYNGGTNTGGQNNAMFFDISSRNLPKTHLYFSWFLDVMSVYDMFDENKHANHWSYKWGARISNPIPNICFTAEYTRTNPLAYKNDLKTTLYTSNDFNMGHFLRDNADELYFGLTYKPFKTIVFDFSWFKQRKGPDMPYIREKNPEDGKSFVLGRIFMESVEWENTTIASKISWQPLNDLYLFVHYQNSNITGDVEKYTPSVFHGKTNTLGAGINFGF
ncbi:MAG: hypothetical protein HC906_00065 [Bacteroidales bacterium]|nr:hypothetical protein [Bacteroidales bacterium]